MQTKSFSDFLQGMATAIQARSSALVNLTVGSVLRAFIEAIAQVAGWLQQQIVYLLATTRLSTSTGTDVDSFIADYGLTRIAAVAATGSVTFARSTATAAAYIPVGTKVQSADGSQSYSVIADTTNAAFDATNNWYAVAAGISSVTVAVQADVAGAAGNALAGAINTMSNAISGIDTVTNALAFTAGKDAETDAAAIARFQAFISGLREGIEAAVASAIDSLQLGLQYSTVQNFAYDGTVQNGYFYVVVSPYESTIQQQVYAAVDAIRPLTITFGVFSATQLTATVSMTVTAAAGYSHATVAAAVQAAITAYIGTIPLGQTLYWSKLYAIAYGVEGVNEVTALTLNGGTADLTATAKEAVVAGTVTVN